MKYGYLLIWSLVGFLAFWIIGALLTPEDAGMAAIVFPFFIGSFGAIIGLISSAIKVFRYNLKITPTKFKLPLILFVVLSMCIAVMLTFL